MKKTIFVTAIVAALSLGILGANSVKAASVGDSIAAGTVVIGTTAINLDYANDSANTDKIRSLIANNSTGTVYVKGFNGTWIDNDTNQAVDASVIKADTYTDASGNVTQLSGTGDDGDFQVVGIQ